MVTTVHTAMPDITARNVQAKVAMGALISFRTIRSVDKLDAEDRAQHYGDGMERSEAKHAVEIHKLFDRGFAGEAVKLPDAFLSTDGDWVRTDTKPFAAAASEAADNEPAFAVLLQACRARKAGQDMGPLLDTFMSACADAYSAEHASDLAKAERDEEIANAWENKL